MKIIREFQYEYKPNFKEHRIMHGAIESLLERIADEKNEWHILGESRTPEQIDRSYPLIVLLKNALHLPTTTFVDISAYRKDDSPDTERCPSKPGNLVVYLNAYYIGNARISRLPGCLTGLMKDFSFKEVRR